jgi:hypothetical protein
MSVVPTPNTFKKAHMNAEMCVFRRFLRDLRGQSLLVGGRGCVGRITAVGLGLTVWFGGVATADLVGVGWGLVLLGGGGGGGVKFFDTPRFPRGLNDALAC